MFFLEVFVEFSIFNFVVVHNRKIPSGLTETHEVDIHTSLMRFSCHTLVSVAMVGRSGDWAVGHGFSGLMLLL